MTGSGPPCKKANPFAAPTAILILLDQGSGIVPSRILKHQHFSVQHFEVVIGEHINGLDDKKIELLLGNHFKSS